MRSARSVSGRAVRAVVCIEGSVVESELSGISHFGLCERHRLEPEQSGASPNQQASRRNMADMSFIKSDIDSLATKLSRLDLTEPEWNVLTAVLASCGTTDVSSFAASTPAPPFATLDELERQEIIKEPVVAAFAAGYTWGR